MLFANGAELIHFSYKRYLENRLREAFGFGGTPLRLIIRERAREEHERKRAIAKSGPKGGTAGEGTRRSVPSRAGQRSAA